MKQSATLKRSATRRHDWIDERSLALHAAIAEKIRRDPKLLEIARRNLGRWMENAGAAALPVLQSWKTKIETWPLEKLLGFITEESERANQLRQSSPFTGILTPQERNEIFARYETL